METRQTKARLDKISWIGLILAGILLAVSFHFNAQEAQRRAQEEAAKRAAAPQEEPGTVGDTGTVAGGSGEGSTDPVRPETETVPEEITTLTHDNVVFEFSNLGGGIRHAEFTNQQEVGDDKTNVRLNRFGDYLIGALTAGPDKFVDGPYKLTKASDREVEFLGKTKDGLYVKKRWSFLDDDEAGSAYRLKLDLTLENAGSEPVDLGGLGLFMGSATALYQREWDQQTTVFYNKGGDFKKKHAGWFKKRDLFEKDFEEAYYAGVSNQFFASILTPAEPYDASMWAKKDMAKLPEAAGGGEKRSLRAALSLPQEKLAADGGKKLLEYELYLGPKDNGTLRALGQDRGNVMDYGWFGIISSPLNWLLNFLHDAIFTHIADKWSWGLSIVALTFIIRGAMWPLQNKSTRSMKRMAKLQPEMAKLKEKYPDDPQKMQAEMMKLYREYNINPVGGCLPMLVQIPIFFGFYRMLQFAVELRQQGFLWVDDLSQPDTLHTFNLPFSLPFLGDQLPVNVLPIVMAATMVLQMALTPKTGDKMQQRIFMLMPLIFFFFCYNFASALALYWTTSNIFAIGQMMINNRLPEPELKKATVKKKGWMQRMQERADEMQRMQKQRGSGNPTAPSKKPRKPRGPRTGG